MPPAPVAAHASAGSLGRRNGGGLEHAAKAETDKLLELLQSNTDLTLQDKQLTEQVATLSDASAHASVSPSSYTLLPVRLHLLLRLEDDPAKRVWRRTVERRYASVPRAGDRLFLDDEETEAHAVKRVTWSNDGGVKLGFGTIEDVDERLLGFGFLRDD